MLIQKMRPVKVATLSVILCLSFFSGSAFPQRYVTRINYEGMPGVSGNPTPVTHLQATISQPEKGEMKFRISLSNPASKAVVITIVRGNDEFFKEIVKAPEYVNTYNMSELEDGEYTVIISSGKDRISKKISISTVTAINRQAEIH